MEFVSELIEAVNPEPWWRFGVALVIGALIGLEREFVQRKVVDNPEFAGLRTFALISLLGAITAYLVEDFGILPAAIAFAGLILLVVGSHVGAVIIERQEGATTEVAALVTFLLGFMTMSPALTIAVALAVIVAGLLALKPWLTRTVEKMNWEDMRTILQFGLVAAVILPLLPNEDFGPYGVINPFKIWLLVVFISGIGFLGYVLMKSIGAEKGVGLTGALGGLVSSTATTVGFSGRSKETPELSAVFAQGILLASSIMFPRILLEVLAVNASLLPYVALPIGAMFVTGLVMVYLLWRRNHQESDASEQRGIDVSNPLKLSTALTFAAIFTIVLIAVEFARDVFREVGVYVVSFITALTDVDAITLSVSQLSSTGELHPQTAAVSIVIAAITNTVVKAVIAYSLGSQELRGIILRSFGVIVAVGLIAGAVLFLL